MFPLSIILIVFALAIAAYVGVGGLSTGAMVFAAGFLLIGTIAVLNVWNRQRIARAGG